MSYFRYASEIYDEEGTEKYIHSLCPLSTDIEKNPYFTYRFYTSEKEDSKTCNVISIGHEKKCPKITKTLKRTRLNLHYVVNGKGSINGENVEKGQFFFTTPFEEYRILSSEGEPLEFYYIGISGNGTDDIIKSAGFDTIPRVNPCPFIDDIPKMFFSPLFEVHENYDTEFYLMSIFLKLIAMHKALNVQKSETSNERTFYYYKNAMVYIQEYLLDGITPSDVAQYLHISPSYLRLIFSKHCNCSLRELLIKMKIECAQSKLAVSNCTVAEAARTVGYEDYTLFSKIFKKYTGLSPQKYKMSFQEKK